MKAFKGTNPSMCCTYGKGTFQYELGKEYTEEEAKTRHTGLHASEYVMEACCWYPPDGKNHIFLGQAEDVDEDGEDIISCKSLTLIRELSLKDICYEALLYMLEHPYRNYEKCGVGFEVKKDRAQVTRGIAIARGSDPRVRAGKGSVIGLCKETDGVITNISMAVVGQKAEPDTWYCIGETGLEKANDKEHSGGKGSKV